MLQWWPSRPHSPGSTVYGIIRYLERIMTMQQNKRFKVRASDAHTRDAGKVRVGGLIKKLPVSPPTPVTRDAGKVQVGGLIKKLPVSPPSPATRDPGKVQVGGLIKKLPKA
jgi:hypothetical protein